VNDRNLVEQTLRGDQTAYRRLIERYRNAVYGLVISFVGDFDQAEDLAQEAFIRGYYRLHTLQNGDRFGTWLRTVAANLCRMELRRQRAFPTEIGDGDLDRLESPEPAPDEIHERDESQRQVMTALNALPHKERETLTLYYLDSQRLEAVGQFLGISPGAAKGRLHRARQKLRKEMLNMAKRTLANKKLTPEFADRIELQEFTDLNRLTDEELKAVVTRSRKKLTLVHALSENDPDTETLRNRVRDQFSKEDREWFDINLRFFQKYRNPQWTFQAEIMDTAHQLQREGAIRPAPERPRPPKGTIQIKRFCDMAKLTDFEIQQVMRNVETVDLAADTRFRPSISPNLRSAITRSRCTLRAMFSASFPSGASTVW